MKHVPAQNTDVQRKIVEHIGLGFLLCLLTVSPEAVVALLVPATVAFLGPAILVPLLLAALADSVALSLSSADMERLLQPPSDW